MSEDASDQVRAIVNAKVEAAERHFKEWLEALRREGPPRNYVSRGDDAPCEALEDRVDACECPPEFPFDLDAPCPSECSDLPSVLLPENLVVPSVESRPPNLHAANLSFAARLVIAVRDRFGGDAPRVYGAANVSRQAYSQIVSDETHHVSKRTAIRFAFALRSTPEEARELLRSAGYAFSNAQTEDFILQACLEVNPPIWDLNVVNQLLREYRVDFQY